MRRHCEPQGVRPRRLRRRALRRAALRYADHGWDVVPGACLVGTRFDCGQPGCQTVACHPAVAHWEAVAGHDPYLVRDWWRSLHHAVLLATGRAVDVLEVPAALGRPVAAGVRGPVSVAPSGRMLFLVRPGEGLRPELRRRMDVLLHGLGSWVPLPPTDHPGGRMRWETPPEEYDWLLPDPYPVQSLLLSAVRGLAEDRPRPTLPHPGTLRHAA
jgi:Bifunctional DNA primase/polymerase, N-terminal